MLSVRLVKVVVLPESVALSVRLLAIRLSVPVLPVLL